MNKPIYGLAGPAGCGKDTLANALVDDGFVKLAFADIIRNTVAAILGVPASKLDDRTFKEAPLVEFGGKSPRVMMQTLGTEWGRQMIDPNLWITIMVRRLSAVAEQPTARGVVVTDVRFENEATALRARGGIIVHIEREALVPIQASAHLSEGGVLPHPSDRRWRNVSGFDHVRHYARQLAA